MSGVPCFLLAIFRESPVPEWEYSPTNKHEQIQSPFPFPREQKPSKRDLCLSRFWWESIKFMRATSTKRDIYFFRQLGLRPGSGGRPDWGSIQTGVAISFHISHYSRWRHLVHVPKPSIECIIRNRRSYTASSLFSPLSQFSRL